MEILAPERQGRVVPRLGKGSMNLAWDFFPGPVLPGKWRQSSKGLGTGNVSICYDNEDQGKQGKDMPGVNH